MFDTTMIGKRIKQARIEKNMTQMNLADAMGVSYQAVSNWERGNSMPDISKLGDLCAALDISVNALLGLEESVPNAVTKAMENEALTMEELAEVAPVLLPENLKVQMQGQCLHISVGDVDVKVEDNSGEELEKEAEASESEEGHPTHKVRVSIKGTKGKSEEGKKRKKLDLSRIAELAPFLDQEYLDRLVREADLSDLSDLEEIAPFLGRETLDYLVEQADVDELEEVMEIVPFLNGETLEKLVRRCEDAEEFDAIAELAPFLSEKTLDELVDRCLEHNRERELEELYPFMGRDTLRKLANHLMEQKDMDTLEDLMPFV